MLVILGSGFFGFFGSGFFNNKCVKKASHLAIIDIKCESFGAGPRLPAGTQSSQLA